MKKIPPRQQLQLFGSWCGAAYILVLLVGWIAFARFCPPHSPSDSAETVAALFQANPNGIRIGMIIVMYAALAVFPFAATIARAVQAIEGRPGILVYSVLMGGAGTAILTFYPAIFWLIAAYRLDRAPELIRLMDDLAWLQLVGGVSLFYAMPLAIAYTAFNDTRSKPPFPRWAGYYNLWVIATILPDQLMFFFHRGPFAWNGIFGFWLPLIGYSSWFFVTGHLLRRHILANGNSAITGDGADAHA